MKWFESQKVEVPVEETTPDEPTVVVEDNNNDEVSEI